MLAFFLARLRPNPPSLDILGPGPFTNLVTGDDRAWTNALAHVWFGLLCPLLGYYVASSRGLRIAAASCAAFVLVRQTFFHGRTAGPEVRTDLVTGLGPILLVLLVEAAR